MQTLQHARSCGFKVLSILVVILNLAGLAVAGVSVRDNSSAGRQAATYLIKVNGRPLTGPNSLAIERGGRLTVPVIALADALGQRTTIDAAARSISVVDPAGVRSTLDARTGQIIRGQQVMLAFSDRSEIVFTPVASAMLLPVELASVLFEVSIRRDAKAVVVTSGAVATSPVQRRSTTSAAEIYRAEYEYGLNRSFSYTSHDLVLTAAGRLGDGRFDLRGNTAGTSVRNVRIRNISFALSRPNGQRVIAGDLGAGTSLPLVSSNIRGASVSLPVSSAGITLFGGRSASGDVAFQNLTHKQQTRDTTVVGGSIDRALGPAGGVISLGATHFSGSSRSGSVISGGANVVRGRISLRADAGLGKFSGQGRERDKIDGIGSAIDIAASVMLAENLTLQSRFTHIGRSFLGPQSGLREPVKAAAAGVSWSPFRSITTTLNVSTARRPGASQRDDSFVTAAVAITPGAGKPQFHFSHTRSRSQTYRNGAFSLVTASKDFTRWRLFLNASRIRTVGPANVNAQVGVNVSISDHNSIEASQGFGTGRALNGTLDWRSSGWLGGKLSFTAGMGYQKTMKEGLTFSERSSVGIRLPLGTTISVNYMRSPSGPTLLVQVRGSIFKRREAAAFLNAMPSELSRLGSIDGRVYRDINGDGRYEAGVDKPQAGVKVRVDGNRYVESDANGHFRFDAVTAGDHKLYIDLLTVRADLTVVGGDSHTLDIGGGRTTSLDFRLVPTGRISGRVWLDANGNGKFDEGEPPLADIRIVTASGRDAITDVDGHYMIADLAPGEHILTIDEGTLSGKMTTAGKPLSVNVFAGRETAEVMFAIAPKAPEVRRFGTQ